MDVLEDIIEFDFVKMPIKIVPLGAGQDVGRSCIIAEVGGRTIMLDCGIHIVD